MSYSFVPCCQLNSTCTFFVPQSATVPPTKTTYVSQLLPGTLSMHVFSWMFPPGLMVVPVQVRLVPEPSGLMVPLLTVWARVPTNGIVQRKPKPVRQRRAAKVLRAEVGC